METMELIIETAFLAFIENGYDRVSLNEIIRRTGLTKGAFYHYFTSKSELIQEVVKKYFFTHISNTIGAIDGSGETFREKMVKIYSNVLNVNIRFNNYQDRIIDRNEFMHLLQECMDMDKDLRKIVFEQQIKTISTMRKAIEEGKINREIRDDVDSLDLAELINATVRGTMISSVTLSKKETEEKLKKNMETMLTLICI
ncbi:TetR/AcrR family transcriptional regulator [Vallitalea guaymasensis]|uniref:TetR/AcrR family transcriptional regulator n=2 Tax=Vallitalea guaymasensis TaxID=1185412 RepID=UPI0023528860|nr:TetR/AcrR family transcriptional regulator [Vallitalea guaymasensis]